MAVEAEEESGINSKDEHSFIDNDMCRHESFVFKSSCLLERRHIMSSKSILPKVIADELKSMGFRCKKKLWYRLIDNQIIQYFQFSSNRFGIRSLVIASDPIFAPTFHVGFWELPSLEVPSYSEFYAPEIYCKTHGVDLGMATHLLNAKMVKTEEAQNFMIAIFQDTVKPIFEQSVSLESNFETYKRLLYCIYTMVHDDPEPYETFDVSPYGNKRYLYECCYFHQYEECLKCIYTQRKMAIERLDLTWDLSEEERSKQKRQYSNLDQDIIDAINNGTISQKIEASYKTTWKILQEQLLN